MEKDFTKNILAAMRTESGKSGNNDVDLDLDRGNDSEGRQTFIGRDVPGDAELNREPVLKQDPSPGDDRARRRVIVIHRCRFPRLSLRRRLTNFRKV